MHPSSSSDPTSRQPLATTLATLDPWEIDIYCSGNMSGVEAVDGINSALGVLLKCTVKAHILHHPGNMGLG